MTPCIRSRRTVYFSLNPTNVSPEGISGPGLTSEVSAVPIPACRGWRPRSLPKHPLPALPCKTCQRLAVPTPLAGLPCGRGMRRTPRLASDENSAFLFRVMPGVVSQTGWTT
jgi:hypothetical protein